MATTETVKRITAADVIANLKNRFPAQQYAFLQQVAPHTGARGSYRWADAVAMSVWPSRGYDIHGIEVKVSRYDWLQELRQPEKSASVQAYCNRWWIATPDANLIQTGELPPTWGHMVMHKDGMKVLVEAPALEAKSPTIEFVASVFRNFQQADAADVARKINEAVREAEESSRGYDRQRYADLKKEVDEFTAASGIKIDGWQGGKDMGEAVEKLLSMKYRLDNVRSGINACKAISEMLETVEKFASLMPTEVKP